MKNIKGYTLLELLVVIGLITILMSFGIASYSTAQQKARDSKRKSDLKLLQNAMEQYYSICSFSYPLPDASGKYPSIAAATPACQIAKTILPNLVDPMGGRYMCVDGSSCTATGYKICPPIIAGTNKYLETEDCTSASPGTSDTCCLSSQQ